MTTLAVALAALAVAIVALFLVLRRSAAPDINTIAYPAASTPAPTQLAAAPPAASDGLEAILADAGGRKIEAIKLMRELHPGMGLKEAKDAVETPGFRIAAGLSQAQADHIAQSFAQIGARVEVR